MALAELSLGDQTIQYDREKTLTLYCEIADGSADRCACAACRNFIAQRRSAFPASFRQLLDQLGIDSGKEEHLYDCYGDSAKVGTVTYGGWFCLSGQMVKAGESMTDLDGVQCYFRRVGSEPSLLVLEFELTLNSPSPDTPSA